MMFTFVTVYTDKVNAVRSSDITQFCSSCHRGIQAAGERRRKASIMSLCGNCQNKDRKYLKMH